MISDFLPIIAADVVFWNWWLPTRVGIRLKLEDSFMTTKVVPFRRFAFLDFEASSLDRDSWPIEVGLSWIDDSHEIQTFESLIRPAPEWSEEAWSQASALVHNIPRSSLEKAPRVEVVAQGLLKALGGRIALSEPPPYPRCRTTASIKATRQL